MISVKAKIWPHFPLQNQGSEVGVGSGVAGLGAGPSCPGLIRRPRGVVGEVGGRQVLGPNQSLWFVYLWFLTRVGHLLKIRLVKKWIYS